LYCGLTYFIFSRYFGVEASETNLSGYAFRVDGWV
jgi:hypothetical protein